MSLDACVTCGKPRDAHYGVLKTCNVYPTYRSARDVIAQGTEAQRAETVEQGSVHDGPVREANAPDLNHPLSGIQHDDR